ncbi:C6 finger domain-containing protein [Metarhizium anisopliae]|nr:C6 finger domain-containing protein [Metarhizium anisopliae]
MPDDKTETYKPSSNRTSSPADQLNGWLKQIDHPPETRDRRLLEIGLMGHYVTKTSPSTCTDDPMQPFFAEAILEKSADCDALLYALYSTAALHRARTDRTREDTSTSLDIHRRYLSMALREHQSVLRNITSENIDAICLTSAFFRICSYAMIQARQRQPYTPPVEWLMVVGTTRVLFQEAWSVAKDKPDSIAYTYLSSDSITHDTNVIREHCQHSHLAFLHVMTRRADDIKTEPWNTDTEGAYVEALRYLSEVKNGLDNGAAKFLVLRQLIRFPMIIPKPLLDLILDCQPRSLVVLAHYFALLTLFENSWYIGLGPKQEVLGIADRLSSSPRWRHLLDWPLQMINARKKAPSAI